MPYKSNNKPWRELYLNKFVELLSDVKVYICEPLLKCLIAQSDSMYGFQHCSYQPACEALLFQELV